MATVAGLVCVVCGRSYDPAQVRAVCQACGVDGILDVRYDLAERRLLATRERFDAGPPGPLRWAPLLPLGPAGPVPPVAVGDTPVYRSPALASDLGVGEVWIKDDGRNPSASLKDRASYVGVALAMALGERTVAAASTGNAAASLALVAAAAGLQAVVFVPRTAPDAKIAQVLIHGARVLAVDGPYETAWDLCWEACREFGWYSRACSVNPYLVEGKKTAALEWARQEGWRVPDTVHVGVGDGDIVSALGKGFREMADLGLVDAVPRLIGVQAEGAAPIARAWREGLDVVPVECETLADSIACGRPRNWRKAVAAIEATGGEFVTVTDDEILEAMRVLARRAGVFGEPAGVAGFAGLMRRVREGRTASGERVGVLVTGSGLKDVRAAVRAAGAPRVVSPTMAAVRAAVG